MENTFSHRLSRRWRSSTCVAVRENIIGSPRRFCRQAKRRSLTLTPLAQSCRTLESLEPFYLCYGGIGDFLLALSTPLEHDEPITVVAAPNSISVARAFFDCFPQIERVYFIERPDDPSDRYVSGLFLRAAAAVCKNCHGRGVTPPGREDDFWKPGLDIVRTCGVTLHPAWVQRYRVDQIEHPQVVLAPMGSLSGMFRSKRNSMPPQYWDRLLALLRANGIRPLIVGTPEEAVAYPADGWAHD